MTLPANMIEIIKKAANLLVYILDLLKVDTTDLEASINEWADTLID